MEESGREFDDLISMVSSASEECENVKRQMRRKMFEWQDELAHIQAQLQAVEDRLPEQSNESRGKRQMFVQKASVEAKLDGLASSIRVMAASLGIHLHTNAICESPLRNSESGTVCGTKFTARSPRELDELIHTHFQEESTGCSIDHLVYVKYRLIE
eukprot:m.289208 g.289208  ORF g.289208 m.289208 type:complete len:157 (-) comp12093_c0_seq1:2555-3025(-)